MASAYIKIPDLVVETDLSLFPDAGPAVDTLSASAKAATYHRLNPYFAEVPEEREVKVAYTCTNNVVHSVEYAEHTTDDDITLPQSIEWVGEFRVDETRLKATQACENHRPLEVKKPPSAKVARAIKCTFRVTERLNLQTWEWEPVSDLPGYRAKCTLDFELEP